MGKDDSNIKYAAKCLDCDFKFEVTDEDINNAYFNDERFHGLFHCPNCGWIYNKQMHERVIDGIITNFIIK